MKKILASIALLAVAATASAADLTVSATRNTRTDTNAAVVTLGQSYSNGLRATVTAGQTVGNSVDANVVGLGGTFALRNVGPVALYAKAGVDYVAPLGAAAQNGYAGRLGFEAALPLSQNLSLVGALERVEAGGRIRFYEGNHVTLGLRGSF